MSRKQSLLCFLMILISGTSCTEEINKQSFPKDFVFAAANTVYNNKDAMDTDVESEHQWIISDNINSKKENIELLKAAGITHYRVTLLWNKILSSDSSSGINQTEINNYKTFIRELKNFNIEPIVTLYHWDTPRFEKESGGFLNENFIAKFTEYARICFENFGDDVKIWLTFNEPVLICAINHGSHDRLIDDGYFPSIDEYKCGHNLIRAHAKVYHLYDKTFRPKQKGKISLTLSAEAVLSHEKISGTETMNEPETFSISWFANPIYKGDYVKAIGQPNETNHGNLNIPTFTDEDLEYINGTTDFFGLNYYSMKTEASWKLQNLLNFIKTQYDNLPLFLTEYSYNYKDDILVDVKNYNQRLSNTIKSALEDGVNIFGYALWNVDGSFKWLDERIPEKEEINRRRFPKGFYFAMVTSGYQVEGAWNEDGKGEHNWDRFAHMVPSRVVGHQTGDVAADSYHKYKDDVRILKELNASHYKFSIVWSRILPTGFSNKVNQAGINYYKNLIKELKDNNIEPIVTLCHWDIPQKLDEMGGLLNEYVIDRFVEYAKICFENFGNEVKFWITFNEPVVFCHFVYGTDIFPPVDRYFPGIGEYLCGHNLLKAHARAYHLYDKEFRPKQNGSLSISINTNWFIPDTIADIKAAKRAQAFGLGWFADPIYRGDYSVQMRNTIDRRSKIQGFAESRLPKFTEEEIKYIKGTADFFSLNYYSTKMVKQALDLKYDVLAYAADSEIVTFSKPYWPTLFGYEFSSVPTGVRNVLNYIKKEYGDIPIFITENGWVDNTTTLEDDSRIEYVQKHLSNIRSAMDDGVNVIGYTLYSLMDSFEWINGFGVKFGVYRVDFNSPNKTRTPKKSAKFVRNVFTTRCIVDDSECYD